MENRYAIIDSNKNIFSVVEIPDTYSIEKYMEDFPNMEYIKQQ